MSLVIAQNHLKTTFHQRLNQAKALITQNSLELQIVEYRFFRRYTVGSTIALIGAPCIGKSTLINKIVTICSDFTEETGENAVFNYGYTFLEENYKKWGISQENWYNLLWVMKSTIDKWLIMGALYDTERSKSLIDRFTHASNHQKEIAKETLHTLRISFMRSISMFTPPSEMDTLIKNVFDRSLKGKNSIFKSTDRIDANPYSKYFHKVFVYCPFSEYIERVDEKIRIVLISADTNLDEVVIGVYPLLQYASLVRAKNENDENSNVLDSISPRIVLKCFRKHHNNCLALLARFFREKIDEFKRFKEIQKRDVLKAFGFDERTPLDTVIEIVPKGHYDDVIDTGGFDESVSIDLRTAHATKAILKNYHLYTQPEVMISNPVYRWVNCWEESKQDLS